MNKLVTLRIESVKTFTIEAKESETIQNIKAKIKQKEVDVPCDFQELFISGNQLKDGTRLCDYITAGNTVNMLCRERMINLKITKISTDGIISTGLQVKLNDTVGFLKSLINAAEGISSHEYELIFDGVKLQDDMIIGHSGMENDSILYLVLNPVDTFPLRIVMPCGRGRVETITVKRLNKIFDLKVELQKEIELPINQWHLAYSGKALEDFKTVCACGLEADSLLHVMLPVVQIFVRVQSGVVLTVFIKLSDDVNSLKQKIFEKAGYPVKYQTLNFAGKVLGEGKSFISYGIKMGSTVHLCYHSHAGG